MNINITVEIPDEEDCENCDFEHYDGNDCYCRLFHCRLGDTCCEECLEVRKKTKGVMSDCQGCAYRDKEIERHIKALEKMKEEQEQQKYLLTQKAACKVLGVSRHTLRVLEESGYITRLPTTGNSVLYLQSTLTQFADSIQGQKVLLGKEEKQ